MLSFTDCLFVTVKEMGGDRAPRPLPLQSGFSDNVAYRVLGVHSPSETGEAYFILSNDRDEVWFISNRHLRTRELRPDTTALRFALEPAPQPRFGISSPRITAGRATKSSSTRLTSVKSSKPTSSPAP